MEKSTQQQLPIFIIHLPDAKKREQFMEQQLHEHKLKGEFFNACRGEELSQKFLSKFQIKEGEDLIHRKLMGGELGCFFSNYFLLKKIVAENIPMALVLEDDAVISDEAALLINNPADLPKEWDLLNMGYRPAEMAGQPFIGKETHPLSLRCRGKFMINDKTIRLAPLAQLVYGSYAYLVTSEGAKHLLKAIDSRPIVPFDNFLYTNREYIRYYGTSPCLMSHSHLEGSVLEQYLTKERGSLPKVDRSSYEPLVNKLEQIAHINLGALYKPWSRYKPLLSAYNKARYLRGSFLKTKKLLSKPVMRK